MEICENGKKIPERSRSVLGRFYCNDFQVTFIPRKPYLIYFVFYLVNCIRYCYVIQF